MLLLYIGLARDAIIDASGGPVFQVNSGESYDTIFRGLLFQNGYSTSSSIVSVVASSPTFQNCKFTRGVSAIPGGALSLE